MIHAIFPLLTAALFFGPAAVKHAVRRKPFAFMPNGVSLAVAFLVWSALSYQWVIIVAPEVISKPGNFLLGIDIGLLKLIDEWYFTVSNNSVLRALSSFAFGFLAASIIVWPLLAFFMYNIRKKAGSNG